MWCGYLSEPWSDRKQGMKRDNSVRWCRLQIKVHLRRRRVTSVLVQIAWRVKCRGGCGDEGEMQGIWWCVVWDERRGGRWSWLQWVSGDETDIRGHILHDWIMERKQSLSEECGTGASHATPSDHSCRQQECWVIYRQETVLVTLEWVLSSSTGGSWASVVITFRLNTSVRNFLFFPFWFVFKDICALLMNLKIRSLKTCFKM